MMIYSIKRRALFRKLVTQIQFPLFGGKFSLLSAFSTSGVEESSLHVMKNVVPLLPELVGSAQLITECGKILYNPVNDSLTMFIVFIN
jgi:hypothetical protein